MLSQHALQVVFQHALQQVSRGRVVSQHALLVSRPTPRGEVEGDLAREFSRSTPRGEVEGDLVRGVSRPTTKGEVEGDLAWGGLQAHTQGVPARGGGGLLPGGCVETPLTSTAAGGTHPTGMHSSLNLFLIAYLDI